MNKVIINNLNVNIDKRNLIKSINIELIGGKTYALIGSNGSGKTTLLKTLAGLIPISSQNIFINNSDLFFIKISERAKIISLLLQHSPYDPFTRGIDRIAHGLIPNNGFINNLIYNKIAINKITKALNIAHLLDKFLMHMSGGEQRLIYLAKCLVNEKTQLFLLDEPTVFLDFNQKKNLAKALKNLKSQGKIIIFSSHDQSFIDEVACNVLILEDNLIKCSSGKKE